MKSQNIEFKSEYFKNILLKKYPEIDINKDSNINIEEANKLKSVDLMEQNINDVQDLQHFKNLEYLSLTINNIKYLNLNDFKSDNVLDIFSILLSLSSYKDSVSSK